MATTEPLTAARLAQNSDAPLGGQVALGISDLASFTIPRFASTAARDTAYSARVTAGYAMADGMRSYAAGREYLRTAGAWVAVPGFRGSGATFPSTPVAGDSYYHTTFRCTMVYSGTEWRQGDIVQVTDAADRGSYVAALTSAALSMHNGFMVFEANTDRLYLCTVTASNTLAYYGGGTPPVVALSVLAGFQAAATSYFALAYYLDGSGLVHIQGTVSNVNAYGPGLSNNVAVLPTVARPARTVAFPISANTGTPAGCQITSDGGIKISPNASVGANSLFTLDGIVFNPSNAA